LYEKKWIPDADQKTAPLFVPLRFNPKNPIPMSETVSIIQAMLSPAVMVNCCGLLLLGMNSKYSQVVGRIRILDEEKRKLNLAATTSELAPHQQHRLANIQLQTTKLLYRIKLVRNAVVSYSVAVAVFILTCFAIGIKYTIADVDFMSPVCILLFLLGLTCIFVGVVFAAKEVMRGFDIVKIEADEFVVE
jgi:hypothetical protein